MHKQDGGEGTEIGAKTKITLSTVVLLFGIVSTAAANYYTLSGELKSIRSEMRTLRINVTDRWTRSMQILWAERLANQNQGKIVVPNVQEAADAIPIPKDQQ